MNIENKNIINLKIKKEEKILDFNDFQKQSLKFDITKLQESYKQIVQTKRTIKTHICFFSTHDPCIFAVVYASTHFYCKTGMGPSLKPNRLGGKRVIC